APDSISKILRTQPRQFLQRNHIKDILPQIHAAIDAAHDELDGLDVIRSRSVLYNPLKFLKGAAAQMLQHHSELFHHKALEEDLLKRQLDLYQLTSLCSHGPGVAVWRMRLFVKPKVDPGIILCFLDKIDIIGSYRNRV